MKLLKLLFAVFLLFGTSIIAQEKFAPEEVILGTLVRQTMPLRDYPTMPN